MTSSSVGRRPGCVVGVGVILEAEANRMLECMAPDTFDTWHAHTVQRKDVDRRGILATMSHKTYDVPYHISPNGSRHFVGQVTLLFWCPWHAADHVLVSR